MKNKGFTLIELLATLVLIALIISIIYQMFSKQVNNSKESVYERQINTIIQISKDYHLQNLNKKYVTIDELSNSGLIDNEELIDPRNGNLIDGCVRFVKNNEYNQYDYIYESNINRCK